MKKENTSDKSINRREFLKRLHTAAAVACAPAFVGCGPDPKSAASGEKNASTSTKPKGEMTYRITH